MKYKKIQLKDENFLKAIRGEAEEYIIHDMFLEAFRLSRDLENSLNENREIKSEMLGLYSEYRTIIVKLKWIGLNILREKEIVDLFENDFVPTFDIEYFDVWEKLKVALICIIVLEDRDKLKADIRNALINNKERLTGSMMNNGIRKEGTVGNWLADYTKNLGAGVVDKLELSQYLINGDNIKKLNENERVKVKVLFRLFERLKLSSLTLEGVEEEVPIDEEFGRGVIFQGVPEFYKEDKKQKKLFEIADKIIRERDGVDKKINPEPSLRELANKYPVGSLEYKAILEEIRRQEGPARQTDR